MSNNFQGYLFKALKTNTIFPNRYIKFDSYETTPNQREEIKAYRDENTRKLYRFPASGKKTVFNFTIRPLHLEDKIAVQKWFTDNEESADHEQRKIHLLYWNDEDNIYKEGWFYRPNLKFKIIRVEDDDILYNEQTVDLIEY